MILSILIPSIPERREKLTALLDVLYGQLSRLNRNHPSLGSVEILVDDSVKFLDGGLSIGGKRDLLKQRAGGKYLCFLDDDDTVMPNYLETLVRLCNEGQDIVTFRALVKNDYYCGIIDMDLTTQNNTEVSPHGITPRTPWHICPVKSEIAKSEPFTELNHNEDWDWMNRVLKRVHSQSHSDMILTQYNHSESGSEADKIVGVHTEQVHRTLLITLAIDGREKYTEKLIGLQHSLNLWPYDTRLYKSYPAYCTPNDVIPYKFKFDLIQQARKDGYNRVIWLDSSIRLVGDVCSMFGDEGIIAFHNLGHPLDKYISDKAQAILNVNDNQLKTIPQTWGGAIGFDFTKDKACEIFEEILAHSLDGCFETNGSRRQGFVAHRHDQAVMSVVFWKHKYKLIPYGFIAAKDGVTEQTVLQYGD
jgi:hypothetical protein